jgi:hypothetical protein
MVLIFRWIGIFPENTPSFRLVKKHGFKEIGKREKIGNMTYGDLAGTWRDVILVERRSAITGIDWINLITRADRYAPADVSLHLSTSNSQF